MISWLNDPIMSTSPLWLLFIIEALHGLIDHFIIICICMYYHYSVASVRNELICAYCKRNVFRIQTFFSLVHQDTPWADMCLRRMWMECSCLSAIDRMTIIIIIIIVVLFVDWRYHCSCLQSVSQCAPPHRHSFIFFSSIYSFLRFCLLNYSSLCWKCKYNPHCLASLNGIHQYQLNWRKTKRKRFKIDGSGKCKSKIKSFNSVATSIRYTIGWRINHKY